MDIQNLIEGLLGGWGAAPAIFLWIGVLRTVFKPTFTYLQKVAEATPFEKDDTILAEVMDSKAYKTIGFILDFLGSIKIPAKK